MNRCFLHRKTRLDASQEKVQKWWWGKGRVVAKEGLSVKVLQIRIMNKETVVVVIKKLFGSSQIGFMKMEKEPMYKMGAERKEERNWR